MIYDSLNIKMAKRLTEKSSHMVPEPTGITYELYIDMAEKIIREMVAAGRQESDGLITDVNPMPDPTKRQIYYCHSTARFVGALGNLIQEGRCIDLSDCLILSYELLLSLLNKSPSNYSPEFWIKEMLFAHNAIKTRKLVSEHKILNWENIWNNHQAPMCYNCGLTDHKYNGWVFAVIGEMMKLSSGFKGCMETIEHGIEVLLKLITKDSLYCEIHEPITYDLVVRQQLDYILQLGYNGKHKDTLENLCESSGYLTLLLQSTTFHAPFGGRSNQFIFVEGHMAALFESRALYYMNKGCYDIAGVYKRAARKTVDSIKFWVSLSPHRHIKNCFDPLLGHGVDSGGFYTVYGALAASLFMIAAKTARFSDLYVEERITPVETCGYVVKLHPEFHKVFATCKGYHIEIDTKADLQKDTTGFCRLHKAGIMPETALSMGITATPNYTFNIPGIPKPLSNLCIGPVDLDEKGLALSAMSAEITNIRLNIINQSDDRIEFDVEYFTTLWCEPLKEKYILDDTGVLYEVFLPKTVKNTMISVPIIKTNGLYDSEIYFSHNHLMVKFMNHTYTVGILDSADIKIDYNQLYANRNAVYYMAVINFKDSVDNKIKFEIL